MADVNLTATIEPEFTIPDVEADMVRGLRTGGGSSPAGLVTRPALMGEMGARVVNHNVQQHVIRTPEGHLEFYVGSALVGVLDVYSRLLLKGSLSEAQTTNRSVMTAALTADGVLEYLSAGPSWAFALVENGQPVQAVTLGASGNLSIYRVAESRFPLSPASSPAFGSAYVVNSEGETHITVDLSRSGARLDPTYIAKSGTVVAFDTGWVLPQSAAEQDDGGSGWANHSNVLLNNGSAATSLLAGSGGLSETLHVLGYAFGLPSGGILSVDGIEVRASVSVVSTSSQVLEDTVRLVVGGVAVGDDKATVTPWEDESADTFRTWGGPADRWGLSEQQIGAVLSAADFGMALRVINSGSATRTVRAQNVQIRIYGRGYTVLPHATINVREIVERAI